MNQAKLMDWCLIRYTPLARTKSMKILTAFFALPTEKAVCLFGRTYGDSRANEESDIFAAGHRIVSSDLFAFCSTVAATRNTVYELGEIHPVYAEWLTAQGYTMTTDEIKYEPEKTMQILIDEHTPLVHICEVCGEETVLTSEESFKNGWDYPPRMGTFGVLSPRTCGKCAIDKTLWWAMTTNNMSLDALNERQLQTLDRILQEPKSIVVHSCTIKRRKGST